jgi:hypothetical protein
METVAYWVFLLTMADDFGRAYAKPEIIKGRGFPLRDEITPEIIEVKLRELQAENLLILYEIEGRRYFQLANWERHNRLRAKSSKHPGLDVKGVNLLTDESACKHMLSDDHLDGIGIGIGIGERDSKESLSVSAKKPRKPTVKKSVDPKKAAERQLFLHWFCYAFRESQGDRYRVEGAKDGNILKALLSRVPVKELVAKACGMFTDVNFPKSKRPSLGMLSAKLNDYPATINGKLDDFRQRGLLPPSGVLLEDWTPWKEQEIETATV